MKSSELWKEYRELEGDVTLLQVQLMSMKHLDLPADELDVLLTEKRTVCANKVKRMDELLAMLQENRAEAAGSEAAPVSLARTAVAGGGSVPNFEGDPGEPERYDIEFNTTPHD